jgi:hypothetical protein
LSPLCARTREELTDIIPASVMAAKVEIAATEPAHSLLFIMEASTFKPILQNIRVHCAFAVARLGKKEQTAARTASLPPPGRPRE